MKLNLHNVQRFQDKTFLLPDKGLVLVEGDNSTGKSTIVRAITALFSYNETAPSYLLKELLHLLYIRALNLNRIEPT